MTRIEDRLRVLDLQLQPVGRHPSDERLAVIAGGGDPDAAEAAHLAGCDECVELLVTLGEGLASLAEEQPQLTALVTSRLVDRAARRGSLAPVLLGLGIAAAAAAATVGYVVRGQAPVAVVEPVHTPSRALSQTPLPPAEPEVTVPDAAVLEPAPTPAVPTAIAPESEPPAPSRAMDAPKPGVAPRTPGPAPEPPPEIGLAGRGQRALERRNVNGPPRGWGELNIITKPASQVFVDGRLRGWTPIVRLRLPEGPHDVRLVYESDLAAEPEQRFRVMIDPERPWDVREVNVGRGP